MTERKREKKSESIEVRVPYELKQEFVRRAASEGSSVSELIRQFMADYLAPQPKESRSMILLAWKPVAMLGATGLVALMSFGAPTAVHAAPDLKAVFAQFDADRDGSISADGFNRHTAANTFAFRHTATVKGSADSASVPAGRPSPDGAMPFAIPFHGPGHPPAAGVFAPPAEMTRAAFVRHDVNGDGKVGFGEFEQHHRQMMEAGFRTHDRNGDGAIDAGELSAVAKLLPAGSTGPSLHKLDRNGDGKVTREEFLD